MIIVHDVRGYAVFSRELYDYMMIEVATGDLAIHENGIAVQDGGWPVAVFRAPTNDHEVHELQDGTTWDQHLENMVSTGIQSSETAAKVQEGLLVAWAIACG